MNKKGLFFSIMALVLVLFFVASIRPGPELVFQSSKELAIVSNMNDFVIDMESNYLSGLLQSTFMRSLNVTLNETIANPHVVLDLDVIKELMIYATSSEIPPSSLEVIKDHALIDSFDTLQDQIEEVYSVDSSFGIVELDIVEEERWYITIKLNVTYNISSPIANWTNRNSLINANVSILGLPDPLYLREQQEIVTVDNNLNSWTTDIVEANWTLQNITDVREERLFVPDENAPSYLNRLVYDYDEDSECCGYESFVISTQQHTHIDHKFYGGDSFEGDDFYVIKGITNPSLIVDHNEIKKYNLCEIPVRSLTGSEDSQIRYLELCGERLE